MSKPTTLATPDDIIRTPYYRANGRNLEPGTEFSVKGFPGRFVFIEHARHRRSGAEWITAYGGDRDPRGRRQFHSFDPDRIRTVHRRREMSRR